MYPPSLEKLITIFTRFPGIGPRTATRFAFYCSQLPSEIIEEIITTLKEVKQSVKNCKICFRSYQEEGDLCSICQDKRRERDVICIVEKEVDLLSIEKIKEYNGLYFILGGNISTLKKTDFKNIRVKELKERLTNPKKFHLSNIREVVIATNQNTQGEATALYLTRLLDQLKIKTTRLRRGLSTGSELEYADEETLIWAFKGRK